MKNVPMVSFLLLQGKACRNFAQILHAIARPHALPVFLFGKHTQPSLHDNAAHVAFLLLVYIMMPYPADFAFTYLFALIVPLWHMVAHSKGSIVYLKHIQISNMTCIGASKHVSGNPQAPLCGLSFGSSMVGLTKAV